MIQLEYEYGFRVDHKNNYVIRDDKPTDIFTC